MKYKIIKSDILLEGRLLPEGSEVELTKEQTKGIEDFLESISGHSAAGDSHSALDAGSDSKSLPGLASSEAKTRHSALDSGSPKKVTKKKSKR